MSEWCIVALPKENSTVWRMSSEKVPHMTLLLFGEQTGLEKFKLISEFLEHISQSQTPFRMHVSKRGVLGDDKADVLFFVDNPWVNTMREVLLKDETIRRAHASVEQYPSWIPHLTLGYPKTPALKAADVENLEYLSVEFDRIALWNFDCEGPTFNLKEVGSALEIMYSKTEEFLSHYGVKGMKWGVIRENYSSLRNRELASTTLKTKHGEDVTVKQTRVAAVAAAIAAVSSRANRHISGSKTFTISVGGKEVGECGYSRKDKDTASLDWLGVRSEERGKGYASAVFAAGVKQAKSEGYKKLTLEVPGNSPDAEHIYTKMGFKRTGKNLSEDEDDTVWGGLYVMEYKIK